jgi:hypothetical protein
MTPFLRATFHYRSFKHYSIDKIKEKRTNNKRRFGRKMDMMKEIGELIEAAKSLVVRDIRLRDESKVDFVNAEWMNDMKKLSKFG